MSDEETPKKVGVERHIQTLVTSVTLALLMWTGLTLVDLRDRLARLEEKIISINADVNRAQADRFTATDWKREKEILDERFRQLERETDWYHRRNNNETRR